MGWFERSKPKPKAAAQPPSRQVKVGGDPEATDTQTIAWHFHRLDRDHELWGWDKLKAKDWRLILAELQALEGMTWQQLKQQAGGRARGTNHHSLPTEEFCRDAQNRLVDLHLDEYDTLFSLRIQNTLRLYGVRDGRVLRLVWHDPHHGSANGCYPTAQR